MLHNNIQTVKALIFDLDGVVTQTRETHKKAWYELFQWFFKEMGFSGQHPMSDEDYQLYIDGKPRYQGVQSFLDSRKITWPYGNTDDEPGIDSVCALGNKKNDIFHEVVDREGVKIFPDAKEKIIYWRAQGLKTAIVSSSKNCLKVLKAAGIDSWFDARVDGVVSESMGLNGKPDPDIFIEAARLLGVSPLEAVVFEDAISGVQAGQKGYFALVVGVDRFDNEKALLENGADIVLDDLSGLDLYDEDLVRDYFTRQGEPVFPENKTLFSILNKKKPVIFLDYDGTLTPIVQRPEDALLSEEMKHMLGELAKVFTVAVVTGRDKEDVEQLIGLDQLIYAGSHGYIISGPDGMQMEHPDSGRLIPELDRMEKDIEEALEGKTEGVQIDRKRYAIGIHYRNAREGDEALVFDVVDMILEKYRGYKKGEGKKIVEVKPDLDWHKGKAVDWILQALELDENDEIIPVFIGDDLTDEDAFESLKGKGIGILVGGHGKPTAAAYSLKNVFQVRAFFDRLIALYQ
jgi:trehalose 6-phosphate phosphatase